MQKLYAGLVIIFFTLSMNAQDHYLVEFESFTPPEKDLISHLKGFPAEAFLAKDVGGKEHFLNDYRGKTVLLFFYSVVDKPSYDWLPLLNLLQIQYIDDLQIFGFAEEERSIIESATKDAAIVNEDGIIKEVLPRSWFSRYTSEQASSHMDDILTKMMYGK